MMKKLAGLLAVDKEHDKENLRGKLGGKEQVQDQS